MKPNNPIVHSADYIMYPAWIAWIRITYRKIKTWIYFKIKGSR